MDEKHFKDTTNIMTLIGSLFLLFATLWNILVIVAVYKKRYLRSTTNYLIMNIVFSNIISTCLLVPIVIIKMFLREKCILGNFLCKFLHIPFSASFSSILTLTIIAIERYHAIVKPMVYERRLHVEQVKYVLVGIWVGAVVLSIPIYHYAFFDGEACDYYISKESRNVYLKAVMVFTVFIPFFVICFCYVAILRELYFKRSTISPPTTTQQEAIEKRQLFRVSALVTTAFIACYLPLAVTLFVSTFTNIDSKHYKYSCVLYFFETSVNPIVYVSQSSNFRRAFKELLPCFSRLTET